MEKIFDKQGNLIGYKVPNNSEYTKKRKKEFSNIWIKLKENKNENKK